MKAKGRKYELELKRELEKYGWTVIDVASNAGLTGSFDCDLLCWPPGERPLRDWQGRQDPHMVEMEVKYRKTATGFSRLYDEHLFGPGLGTVEVCQWGGDDAESSGVVGLTHELKRFGGLGDRYYVPHKAVSKFIESAFKPGVRVVALRASRKPWVFVWRARPGM